MNDKEIYLSNLEWTKTHDNMGGVKANLIFKNNMSYEEFKEILKETYFVLSNVQLQSNWNSLRECIEENKKVAMEYTKKVELSGLCQGDYPVPYYHAIKRIDLDNLYLDKMNELENGDNK